MNPLTTEIQEKQLASGATLLVEHIPHVRSAALGFWIRFGSRNEPAGAWGGAHFIEHMLFKGTQDFSTQDIALYLENVGGNMNAMTGKEATCYYAKSLSEHLPMSARILSEIFFRSTFDPSEFQREREVILEEINAHIDSPEDLVYDHFMECLFGRKGVGRPILGYEDSVAQIERDRLHEMYRSVYRPENLIVSVSGNLEGCDIEKLIEGEIEAASAGGRESLPVESGPAAYGTSTEFFEKDIEQSHFCLGFRGIPYQNENKYIYSLIDLLLSGGMSSRLFQEVREKRGLVYDIRSDNTNFSDTGVFEVSASCRTGNLPEVLDITLREMLNVAEGRLEDGELDRIKKQLKASIVMSTESVTGRMMKNARSKIYYGRCLPDEEIIGEVEAVTAEGMTRAARELVDPASLSLCVLGPKDAKVEKAARRRVEAFSAV